MSFYENDIKLEKISETNGESVKVTKPRVSVIIPTYYDWTRLQLCIKALQKQTFSQDDFEVIIVNNASEDSPPEDFFFPENVSMITEDKPGSYAARNAALKISQGEIVAFTDSDCIPDPFWLELAVARLDKGAERIAGKIEFFYKSDKLKPVEIYQKYFGFDQEKYAQAGGSATANMVTWARYFETVGYFNDDLMSGGDNEWGMRANDKGISVEYIPEIIVNHPARADVKDMLKKQRRVLGGVVNKSNKNFKNNFLLILFKGYFPPRKALKLFLEKDLTFSDRCLTYLLCYFLKSYSTTYRLALMLGLAKPKRS